MEYHSNKSPPPPSPIYIRDNPTYISSKPPSAASVPVCPLSARTRRQEGQEDVRLTVDPEGAEVSGQCAAGKEWERKRRVVRWMSIGLSGWTGGSEGEVRDE